MKTIARTDAAKFFCGFETFHAITSAWFWSYGTAITTLGITWSPTLGMVGTFIHTAIAIALGVYAWGGKPVVGRATPMTTTPTPPRAATG